MLPTRREVAHTLSRRGCAGLFVRLGCRSERHHSPHRWFFWTSRWGKANPGKAPSEHSRVIRSRLARRIGKRPVAFNLECQTGNESVDRARHGHRRRGVAGVSRRRALGLERLPDRQVEDELATPSDGLARTIDVDHTLVRGCEHPSRDGNPAISLPCEIEIVISLYELSR